MVEQPDLEPKTDAVRIGGSGVDILMVTHRRPSYTERSLKRLLETADEQTRVWIWQNGEDAATLAVIERFRGHPRFYELFRSAKNVGLREPTNWMWSESNGALVGKVDDDCIVPTGWIEELQSCHNEYPRLGGIACWHFREEDFDPDLARPKLEELDRGRKLLRNMWLPGSGYLMKRECITIAGLLEERQTFTDYVLKLALNGWKFGWHYPLLCQDHMDDPRSAYSLIRADSDIRIHAPLSARVNGVDTVAGWEQQLKRSAWLVQTASIDERDYRGWRKMWRRIRARLSKTFRGRYW